MPKIRIQGEKTAFPAATHQISSFYFNIIVHLNVTPRASNIPCEAFVFDVMTSP